MLGSLSTSATAFPVYPFVSDGRLPYTFITHSTPISWESFLNPTICLESIHIQEEGHGCSGVMEAQAREILRDLPKEVAQEDEGDQQGEESVT